MKRIPALSTICISALLAVPAMAQAVPNGCYARYYTPDHLAANPAQVVDWITVLFTPDAGSDQTNASLRVRMANQGRAARDGVGGVVMTQGLSNFVTPMQFHLDGDGGSIEVLGQEGNGLTFRTGGLFLSRGGDFSEDQASNLAEGTGSPTVYRLFAADPSVCR